MSCLETRVRKIILSMTRFCIAAAGIASSLGVTRPPSHTLAGPPAERRPVLKQKLARALLAIGRSLGLGAQGRVKHTSHIKTAQVVVLLLHVGVFALLILGALRTVPGLDIITRLAAGVLVSRAADAVRLHQTALELAGAEEGAWRDLAEVLATLEASRAVLDQALVLRSASSVAYEEAQAALVTLLADLAQLHDKHVALEHEETLAHSSAEADETLGAAVQQARKADCHSGRRSAAQVMDRETARGEVRVVALRGEKDKAKGAAWMLLGRFKGLLEALLF
eukprot:m51a1_g6447 hypothetical protein (281) ;mRNA; r:410044-413628